MENQKKLASFIQEITREAGMLIAEKFGKVGVHHTKLDPTDVVTEADLLSNDHLTKRIRAAYPDHHILSEEGDTKLTGAEYEWIIDPLDGTRNFSTRTPLFGVLVALAYQGELIMSTIADPIQNDLFFAERGQGAFRNGKKIACSTQTDLKHSFGCISASMRGERRIGFYKNILNASLNEPCWLSAFGSAAMSGAYVADGRRDWWVTEGSSIWDYAAPLLILREAGCKVTTADGTDWKLGDGEVIAANPTLHAKILSIIN